MADVGLGGKVPQHVQTDKIKESERLDKRQGVKDREAMAGTQQAEAKHKKEEVKKTAGKFKAYKTAYEYQLGEEPEEQEIDEDLRFAKVEEEEEEVKTKARPTLEEIEEYNNARSRFKAKVALFLGEDFDEEKPYEEENIIIPEVRFENSIQKLILAKHSFNTINQYINDTIGNFDFDRLEDIKLLLGHGMPETAILRFIFLQQLARAGTDFPNVMDMSIIMFKLKNLGIELTDEQVIDLIKADYETLTKLKYTVAGFVYVPLHEVMVIIEEELRKNYQLEFINIFNRLKLEEYPDLNNRLSDSMVESLRGLILPIQKEIAGIMKEKLYLNLKINQISLGKAKAEILEKVNILNNKKEELERELSIIEMELTRIVFVFAFIFSKFSISDFNKFCPINDINSTLNLLLVRYYRKEIVNFLNQRVNVYTLKTGKQELTPPLKKSIETFETKIKGAALSINKQPPPKQQQILRNIRNNPFEINADFYWLRQKNLGNILENCDELMEIFYQYK